MESESGEAVTSTSGTTPWVYHMPYVEAGMVRLSFAIASVAPFKSVDTVGSGNAGHAAPTPPTVQIRRVPDGTFTVGSWWCGATEKVVSWASPPTDLRILPPSTTILGTASPFLASPQTSRSLSRGEGKRITIFPFSSSSVVEKTPFRGSAETEDPLLSMKDRTECAGGR